MQEHQPFVPPYHEDGCAHAALDGCLFTLQHYHRSGKRWNWRTCANAAQNGHLECLRYAHDHGCPWNGAVVARAALHNQPECLRYLIDCGCPYKPDDPLVRKAVARHVMIPKWRESVLVVRPVAMYWLGSAMQTACAHDGQGRAHDLNDFCRDFAPR